MREIVISLVSAVACKSMLDRYTGRDFGSKHFGLVSRNYAQFQHRDAEYPGVVLEISYSQDEMGKI